MTQFFTLHPLNPQPRLIKSAIAIIKQGGVIVYPTDSTYAIGCQIANKEGLGRIRAIRGLGNDHQFTIMCRSLSEISTYARLDNPTFRLLKAYTPGPYTFILKASADVPKRLQQPKRKTIGLRIPDHPIAQALLNELELPLMSISLILPNQEFALSDPHAIYDVLKKRVDLVIDGGLCSRLPTTILDMGDGSPSIVRQGIANFPKD